MIAILFNHFITPAGILAECKAASNPGRRQPMQWKINELWLGYGIPGKECKENARLARREC